MIPILVRETYGIVWGGLSLAMSLSIFGVIQWYAYKRRVFIDSPTEPRFLKDDNMPMLVRALDGILAFLGILSYVMLLLTVVPPLFG